jgi:hypothetical protein
MKRIFNDKPILRRGIILFLVFICLLAAAQSFGQARDRVVANQHIQWAFVSSTIKLNPHYGVFVEQQVGLQAGKNMQHVFRAAVDYTVSSKLSIMPFGYAYTWNYQYGKMPSALYPGAFNGCKQ